VVSGKDLIGCLALRNEGRATFAAPVTVVQDEVLTSFELGDLTGDGADDMAAIDRVGTMFLFDNDGTGMFPSSDLGFLCDYVALAVTDLDGDSHLDLASIGNDLVPDISVSVLEISINDRQDPYGSAWMEFLGGLASSGSLLVTDMDGDGLKDVVTAFMERSSAMGSLRVFLNRFEFPPVSLDKDQDGIPDECQGTSFHRGDSNQDGILDLTDAIVVLGFLFFGGTTPTCIESANVDNDADVDITDPVLILNFLFLGGSPPAPPGPPGSSCGHDPELPGSPGALGCDSYDACA
jgi:hypothetical protein